MTIQIVPVTAANEAEWKRRCAASVNQVIQSLSDAQLVSIAALSYTGNASKVVAVKADESGFELVAGGAGGTTTNALTMNNGGAGAASGTTFDGSVARTISYNTVGAAASGHDHTGVYEPADADLTALAALSGTNTIYYRSGAATWSAVTVAATLSFSGGTLGVADLGVLHVQDQKSSATDGGTFTSGAWQTRVLNTTVLNSITSASLSSNQISLPAGTYDIWAAGVAFQVNNHQTRLQNITDGSTILLGTQAHSRATSTSDGNSESRVDGRFTIAGTKTIELQHRCQTTGTTTGFGSGAGNSWGSTVFSNVFIKRVA